MTIVFLRVIAVILAAFGLFYLASPQTLSTAAGIQANASGLTDIRATYGGFQIGFALFIFWACRSQQRIASALIATLCVFLSVGIGRLFGIVIDNDVSTFNMIGLGFEFSLSVVCAVLYRKHYWQADVVNRSAAI